MEAMMYINERVSIPNDKGHIIKKLIKGTTYVYYKLSRTYDPEKKYTVPKSTSIGKVCPDDSTRMFPNERFLLYYPEEIAQMSESRQQDNSRSSCLKSGAYLVLQKIIAEYHLGELLSEVLGEDSKLFLDLVIYSIITEGNVAQYYPDYAYDHPLKTEKMKIYSDSKVSRLLKSISKDQALQFLELWNKQQDHREKIYISYDSTNKECQAGDIEMVEFGHSKEGSTKSTFNYSVAYDKDNKLPLFYEAYAGSVVDISQLKCMVDKSKSYGYQRVGFILDRGYFSQSNLNYLDENKYDFCIMMKGKKKLVHRFVKQVKGTFEEDWNCRVHDFGVSGTTISDKLFPGDTKKRYFHIYYDEHKRTNEREKLEAKLREMMDYLEKQEGTIDYEFPKKYAKYFTPIYCQTKEGNRFMMVEPKADVINEEISYCGYFVLVTSEKMTAAEALKLYKSRDDSEKLFRGDKSYLGNNALRVYGPESASSKIFVEFIALIVRNRFYNLLKDQKKERGKKSNYMTVPAAIRELEKIEALKQSDGIYRLDHAVTATQKEILKAFDLTAVDMKQQIQEFHKSMSKA